MLAQASRKWAEDQRDMSRQNLQAEIAAMNVATAQVVTETGLDEPNYPAVASAAATISANLPQFSKDARLLAALEEENDGDRLLEAARRLAGAFSDLLNAAQPDNQEVSGGVCIEPTSSQLAHVYKDASIVIRYI